MKVRITARKAKIAGINPTTKVTRKTALMLRSSSALRRFRYRSCDERSQSDVLACFGPVESQEDGRLSALGGVGRLIVPNGPETGGHSFGSLTM